MHDVVVRDLEAARDRTLGLTDLGEPTLVAQHDPLMSPLVWDLAHVGQQEELWLLRGGDPGRRPWPWGTESPGPALANLSGLGLRQHRSAPTPAARPLTGPSR
jgi:hypothetical protein